VSAGVLGDTKICILPFILSQKQRSVFFNIYIYTYMNVSNSVYMKVLYDV